VRITRPSQWRLLNALEFTEGGTSDVDRLMKTQGVSTDDFVSLSHLGLITTSLAGVPVVLGEHTSPRTRINVTVEITPDGRRLLVTDPRNKVLRVFTILRPTRGGIPAVSVQKMAHVENTLLIDMGREELLEGVGETHRPVYLPLFRRIPATLRLQLTPRGRAFLPNP
jgi:hypothetical protein